MLSPMASDMERALGALRDFTRRDILLRFYADHKPRSVDDVAKAAKVHRSVAFEHLERLVSLGYLQSERRRGLPGKPAKIYRLTAGPVQISHPMRRYDVLAEALARSFQSLGDSGRIAIREAGRVYGAGLARTGARSISDAIEPLTEMGGEPLRTHEHFGVSVALLIDRGQAARRCCGGHGVVLLVEVMRRAASPAARLTWPTHRLRLSGVGHAVSRK